MQNIIDNLAKLNFEFVSLSQGALKSLSDFKISSDYKSETTNTNLEKYIMPYIIFDLENHKDEYIFQTLDLLDKFYENRNTSHSNRLIFEEIYEKYYLTSKVILKPMLGNTLTLENIEKQTELFNIAQKEFTDFGTFLNNNIAK